MKSHRPFIRIPLEENPRATKPGLDHNCSLAQKKINQAAKVLEGEVQELYKISKLFQIDTLAQAQEKLQKYQSDTEKHFLERKALKTFLSNLGTPISCGFTPEEAGPSLLGKCDYFPAFLKQVNVSYSYFILPEMLPRRHTINGFSTGAFLKNIINNLIQDAIENGELNNCPYDYATVVFEHHLDQSRGEVAQPDADNLEAKIVTDALNGLLIANDSLSNISTIHLGIMDQKAFTKLHVFSADYTPQWLQKHAILFQKK